MHWILTTLTLVFVLQFGIPPETIKDSMKLGIPVPQVYIVPVERFCREMGPALGVNLAEFEFPAYFNFFVYQKRCTLVVDSVDAEENIRRVFSETLLGPAQFRREKDPISHEDEDFDPDFPRECIPNFEKELKHFRTMPGGKELVIETLLDFRHFEDREEFFGVPPKGPEDEDDEAGEEPTKLSSAAQSDDEEVVEMPKDISGVEKREKEKNPWTYTQTKELGTSLDMDLLAALLSFISRTHLNPILYLQAMLRLCTHSMLLLRRSRIEVSHE